MPLYQNYNIITKYFVIIHFFILLFIGIFRHWSYITSINDLGVFDQSVWGILNRGFPINTSQMDEIINWIGFHFHPFLFFFAPLYFLYSSPIWFVLAQSFAISLSAWIIFLLAKHIFRSEQVVLLWTIIYLLNPFLFNAAAWDFHPVSMAVPFVALCLLGIIKDKFIILIISSLVILTIQEHLGLMVAGFGALWGIRTKKWLQGTTLVLLGFCHFYLVLKVIMPAFSPTGHHVMISEELGHLSRYAWLGDSIGGIILTIISEPLSILKTVMISMGGLEYLILLLMPFMFLPLFGLSFLLPVIADLAANMLSANPMPRSPIAYHSVTLLPVFIIAAMYGVKKISNWQKKFSISELSYIVLIIGAGMSYLLAPLPLPGAKNVWAPASFVSWPDPRVQEIHSLMGKEASLSVQANIGPHFSQRKEIYRYPNRIDQVDAIILRLKSPTQNIHNYSEEQKDNRRFIIGMLDSHLQMDRDDYLASVEELLQEEGFQVAYWDNPWLVFKKGETGKDVVPDVMSKLEELKNKWQ